MNALVAQLFLVVIAAISSAGGIYATFVSRRQNSANAGKAEAETDHLEDSTWIQRLDALNRDFTKLQDLSDERFSRLVEIESMITKHVSWDFMALRLFREHNIEVDEPPSLVYVRRKLQAEKDAIKQILNDSGSTTESS